MDKNKFLLFQEKLNARKYYRYFWQLWSIYAYTFFAITALIIITTADFSDVVKPIGILSLLAFLVSRFIVIFEINLFYERKRPYQLYNFKPLAGLFSGSTTKANSFPSRHVTAYFAVATIVSLYIPALGAFLMIVSILAAVGRVVTGYHWVSDVVAGAIIGIGTALLAVYFAHPVIFTLT